MNSKKILFMIVCLIAVFFVANSFAEVVFSVQEILKMADTPLDVAVPQDGKYIFVLTEHGDIKVYLPDGQLKESINVGKHVDQIEVGPEGYLLLKSRKNKTIEMLTIDFIQDINIEGSPFKGPADAPVVIAVFSDFQ
jgi:hypothetical protein